MISAPSGNISSRKPSCRAAKRGSKGFRFSNRRIFPREYRRSLLNNDVQTASYLWQPVGLDVPLLRNAEYCISDGNKNIIELRDQTGLVTDTYVYDPFGNAEHVGTSENPFQFSSEHFDSETGLVYYNYRYYAPILGRWINRDPIEEQGGVNLYGMCNNDFTNNNDALGCLIIYPMISKNSTSRSERLKQAEALSLDERRKARISQETIQSITKATGLSIQSFVDMNSQTRHNILANGKLNGCFYVVLNIPDAEDAKNLSLMAYSEGTSNSKDDKHAIPTTIINRVKSDLYPNSISSVIFASYQSRNGTRFYEYNAVKGAKWNNGEQLLFAWISDVREWNWSVYAGQKVVNGILYSGVKDAVIFHSNSNFPNTPLKGQYNEKNFIAKRIVQVGRHFYFSLKKRR